MKDLNNIYRNELALHELDCEPSGFEWIDFNDSIHSVISFLRKGKNSKNIILVVCNFTPVPRFNYILGVPENGYWKEILNSDSEVYGGSNHGNIGGVEASMTPSHGRPYSISVTVPPLGLIFFKWMA